jgi:hypothetical protein
VEVGSAIPCEAIIDGLVEIEGGSRAQFRRSIGAADDPDADAQIGGAPAAADRPELLSADDAPIEAEVLEDRSNDGISTTRRTLPGGST